MPDEQPDGGTNTPPGTGHFLPKADELTEGDSLPQAKPNRSQPIGLGKARALSDPGESALRRKARPLPADPDAVSVYSGPPAAPLPGAPTNPLIGTRRTGGARRVGWNRPYSRAGAQYTQVGPPPAPPKQYSRAVIAGLAALTLIVTASVGVACFKAISSYDSSVDNPLSRPSVHRTPAPVPTLPDPTVTVTEAPVPNLVRLQKNEIYKAGKLASVNCKEPSIKPNSQSAILEYYQAMVPCLDDVWAPLIKKSKYTFRSPKVVLKSKKIPASSCTGDSDVSYYCPADETIAIDWEDDLKRYKQAPLEARLWMMSTMAHEYGHHVQQMTEMLTAAWSEEGFEKDAVKKLEWSRRTELQASCFGAAFLGSNKASFALTGNRLTIWEYQTKHTGDEYNPKKERDHGSRANQWFWEGPAFTSASPSSCNTFTASAKRVS
ncbi:neutral zinc metallopeptidase [Kribbella sp. NBC_01505]|uniref:neutral zinc metallopeptidase n=1 Tax=Kribbella sp. NBC_01505 TaxID=2903580 RepID=UPI003868958B